MLTAKPSLKPNIAPVVMACDSMEFQEYGSAIMSAIKNFNPQERKRLRTMLDQLDQQDNPDQEQDTDTDTATDDPPPFKGKPETKAEKTTADASGLSRRSRGTKLTAMDHEQRAANTKSFYEMFPDAAKIKNAW